MYDRLENRNWHRMGDHNHQYRRNPVDSESEVCAVPNSVYEPHHIGKGDGAKPRGPKSPHTSELPEIQELNSFGDQYGHGTHNKNPCAVKCNAGTR
jgi:hypothetical protein